MKTILLWILILITPLSSKEKSLELIYKDAVVYTGVTIYYFTETQTNKPWELKVPFEDRSKYSVPKKLLENPEDVEGPVGANPKMIGKKFKALKLKNGAYKIIPSR